MEEFRFRFDDYLDLINAQEVKALARLWNSKPPTRKADCADIVRKALNDPEKVRSAIATLHPWERNALALLRLLGGMATAQVLNVGLLATGSVLPEQARNWQTHMFDWVKRLFARGLLMGDHFYNPAYFSGYSTATVWSDLRLVVESGYPRVVPLDLHPAGIPTHSISRRPASVALDLLGLIQAVDQQGGLELTKGGSIRATDIRKLRKVLKWTDDVLDLDGFKLLDPATALINALVASGLMVHKDQRIVFKEPLMAFAERPIYEQVRIVLFGVVRNRLWLETSTPKQWFDSDGMNRVAGRLALTLALASLPVEGHHFYSLDDLDEAIFNRIGAEFSLDGSSARPYYYYYDPEAQKNEGKWRAKRRADWLKLERFWIEAALTSWLYYLGVVELAVEDERVTHLRLTELGRSVLHPELPVRPLQASPKGDSQFENTAWVIQPNFDIVVYLERATSAQLAFLERHAEREQAHAHTAHYRLTRDSVYRGLESGSTIEDLLEGLQKGSENELPQNVLVELKEWAALRERLTLRRRASLLEFPDRRALDAALADGLCGKVVGERFLLLPDEQKYAAELTGGLRIDYALPLPKCLSLTEAGTIKLKRGGHDLVIEAQLNRWAEQVSDIEWQLTRQSVAAAVSRGGRIDHLIQLLTERQEGAVPHFLRLALTNWAGHPFQIEMENVIALRCTNPFVFEALASSKRIKPFLRGAVPPDILVVDSQQFEAFNAELAWAALEITPKVTLVPVERVPRGWYR